MSARVKREEYRITGTKRGNLEVGGQYLGQRLFFNYS